jgi:hypothetical protein
LLLASKEDSDKLVAELEKRIRTIGGRNSSSAGRGPRTSSKNWINLRETIAGQLASQDRMAVVERMWDFIGIADDVLERTSDNYGTVEEVFWSGDGPISAGFAPTSLRAIPSSLPGAYCRSLREMDSASNIVL